MDANNNPLNIALREVFAPIVKQSTKWPPVLAYGIPGIVAALLITSLRTTLPPSFFWLMIIAIVGPLAAYIFSDWNTRHLPLGTDIKGNILSEGGLPIKGAFVFVDGVDRKKETGETGWFQISVDKQQDSYTVRAMDIGQVAQKTIAKGDVKNPVIMTLKQSIPRLESSDKPSTSQQELPDLIIEWFKVAHQLAKNFRVAMDNNAPCGRRRFRDPD